MRKLFPVFLLIVAQLAVPPSVIAQADLIYPTSFREQLHVKGGSRLPAMNLESIMDGEKTTLNKLQGAELKYPEKPTLIIFWAKGWCGPCIARIGEMIDAGIDKRYNLIAINVEGDDTSAKRLSRQDIADYIAGKPGWSRIQHYRAKLSQMGELLATESTPLVLLVNRQGLMQDYVLTYNFKASDAEAALGAIDGGRASISADEVHYNMMLTTKSDVRNKTVLRSREGAVTVLRTLNVQSGTREEVSYIRVGEKVYAHGAFRHQTAEGKLYLQGTVDSGYITLAKKWQENGDLILDMNVPALGTGYSKSWYKNGVMESYVRYKDRKLDGLQKSYDDKGRLSYEFLYVAGKRQGLSKSYKEGKLVTEASYSADKLHGTFKEYDTTGELVKERQFKNGVVVK